jgi:hypothetical protein
MVRYAYAELVVQDCLLDQGTEKEMNPTPKTIYPFGPINGVNSVSSHAIERFKERTGATGTFGKILHQMEDWLKRSFKVELKPEARLKKLLNNGVTDADYWCVGTLKKGSGHIMVVVKNTLVTVHRNQSGEWRGITATPPAHTSTR